MAVALRSFLNPELHAQFERDGYVLLPLLDESDVAEMVAIYGAGRESFTSGWHTDMFSDNQEYRRQTMDRAGAVLASRLTPLLADYRYCCGAYVVKEPVLNSEVPLHQDWTVIDPLQSRSINVICPLIATNETNGQLCVVAGSHHPPCRISYGPSDKLPIDSILPDIHRDHLTRLFQRPGEALVYDGRLLHGSGPNTSDQVRICFSAGFIPREAQLLHYFKDAATPDKLYVYEIDDSFFWKHRLGGPPTEGRLVSTIQHCDAPITQDHLDAWAKASGRTG